MPPKKNTLQVVCVPLPYKSEIKTVRYPEMNRLYLELLENKSKVRPDLRTKEYIPTSNLNSVPIQKEEQKKEEVEKQSVKKEDNEKKEEVLETTTPKKLGQGDNVSKFGVKKRKPQILDL